MPGVFNALSDILSIEEEEEERKAVAVEDTPAPLLIQRLSHPRRPVVGTKPDAVSRRQILLPPAPAQLPQRAAAAVGVALRDDDASEASVPHSGQPQRRSDGRSRAGGNPFVSASRMARLQVSAPHCICTCSGRNGDSSRGFRLTRTTRLTNFPSYHIRGGQDRGDITNKLAAAMVVLQG